MFDKDEQEISQIIEEGIDQLLSGQATLEQILAKYPAQAEEIRPELETALWLTARREEIAPRPGFVSASRKRVVERVKQEASGQNAKHGIFGFIWPQRLSFQWVAAVLVVVMLLSGTSGLVSASQGALPGDGLYGLKRISEQVAYNVTFSPTNRVEFSAKLAERRLDEISTLLTRGNFDAVQPALREFERQVNRTVALLQGMRNGDSQSQKDVAASVQSILTSNAERLEALQAGAPAAVVSHLKTAEELSTFGAAMASQVSSGTATPEPATLTPTVSVSPEPSSTNGNSNKNSNPTATFDTPTDESPTDEAGTDLAAEPTPDPGSTVSPTDSTNPNQRVKPPKPSKPEKSNPGKPADNPANNPPKDKPPKDNSNNGNKDNLPPGKNK